MCQGFCPQGVCVCIPACTGADTPGCVSQHALGQTHPPGVYPSMHWGRHPPAAPAADGTHPTGMLSCFNAVNSSQGVNY